MSDHRLERALDRWRRAQARMRATDRTSPTWFDAAAEEWRAHMALREVLETQRALDAAPSTAPPRGAQPRVAQK